MGKIKIDFPDELVTKLAKLEGRTDEVMGRVMNAGAEAVKPIMASNLAGAIGRDTKRKSKSTGQLAGALGITPVRIDEGGTLDIKVGFNEPRSDAGSPGGSKRNAMVASILEHGKSNQPPRPFLKATQVAAKKPAVQAMTDAFNAEVDDL